jgi:hypothetical protein
LRLSGAALGPQQLDDARIMTVPHDRAEPRPAAALAGFYD